MANLTSEQTNRLKAAVKSKLIEIGQYIDDQLIDYVMIMVSNKKTEKQMAEDLELFLGGAEQATSFSSWLHSTIRSWASSKDAKPAKSKSQNVASSSATAHNEMDELAIQIDTNEFNDDFSEENKSNRKKSIPNIKPSEIPNTITNPTPSSTPTSQNEQANIISLKPREDSSKPVSQSSSALSSLKSISSCVGAVINRREDNRPSRYDSKRDDRRDYNQDEDDDDDYRRSGGLSSVIKVSDRKYAVPKSMQPNKSILLKAVDAANTSVSGRTKSIADEKLEQIRSKRLSEPSSSKPIIKTTNSNRIELFTQHHDRDERDDGAKRLRTVSDKRMVSLDSDTHKREIVVDEPLSQAPKFIVTMKGLDDEKFLNKFGAGKSLNKRSFSEIDDENMECIDYQTSYEDLNGDKGEYNDEELLDEDQQMEDDEEEQQMAKKKLIRCAFWPMCDKGEQCPYLHPNKPCTAFPNCQFGQLCHYLHPSCRYDGFCTRADCPFTHVIKKSGPPQPAHSNVSIPAAKTCQADSGEAQLAINAQTPSNPTAKLSAPKITINKIQPYYSLVNKPTAATNSPSAPAEVATMPGSNAYSGKPYPYAVGSQYTLVNRSNTFTNIQINCKYGNLCKNPKCPYIHPNLPQKSQLKWVAPSVSQTNTETDQPLLASSDQAGNNIENESNQAENQGAVLLQV